MAKRPHTNADRDIYTPKTPAKGVEVTPQDWDEDVTGKYDGEELATMRARRKPEDRIGKLETKHDELVKVVTAVQVSVGTMTGQLSVLPELVSVVREAARGVSEREHVTLTAKVEVDKAQKLDEVDAKKARRTLIAQIVTAVIGGGVLGKLLHMAGLL